MSLIWDKVKIIAIIIGFFVIDQLLFILGINFAAGFGMTLMINVLTVIVFTLFWLYAKKRQLIAFGSVSAKSALLWVLGGYIAIYFFNYVGLTIVSLQASDNVHNQAILQQIVAVSAPSFISLFMILVGPLIEELICRYLIPKVLFKGYEPLGFVVGAVVFAALHVPQNLGSWIIYGGMGAVLSFVYYKSKRFEYSLLLHIINNAIAVAILFMLVS
ncbi:CPBP family intramembrane glutamic endopeptidase [Streptococcus sp. zg-JUN1979]|uniref:CPBP family intramembrane glutamic endopeptidase n=1 Tax=Streptococcus sp. zg-JUN1979 TaxID=3391450 RepID=UPI0039A4DB0C